MKIVDWQCHFTEHQVHTWRALEDLVGSPIVHVVAKFQSEARTQQGWARIDVAGLEIVPFKERGWFSQGREILRRYPGAIHVFGGFWADRRFFPLIIYAALCGIKIAVMNESYATEGVGYLANESATTARFKAALRPWLYRLVALLLRAISRPWRTCVLGLSMRAVRQFTRAGFSEDQVFPFGYFVPRLVVEQQQDKSLPHTVKLIFVGALIERKGIDLVVAAVEALHQSGLDVQLDIYGHGNPADYVAENSACVFYKGPIPFGRAQTVVSQYDALVLPSRHDGWGVVVNEALLQGVPVIVSDHVGAKCLVDRDCAGIAFSSGDVASLKNAIHRFASDLALRREIEFNAARVGDHLLPEVAASYMRGVFDHFFFNDGDRPDGVWCAR